jgi:dynamin family protein
MTLQPIDAVLLLADVSDDIDFAADAVAAADLPVDARAELTDRLGRIRQRAEDPNVYLAVVGEFSAGKSSFINAVMRHPLLRSGSLVTTVAATEVRFGADVDLAMRVRETDRWLSYRADGDEISAELERLSGTPIAGATLEDLVDLVACDESVGDGLAAIRILWPAPLLRDQVVLIDTPGLNADDKHTGITEEVVRDRADTAVILVPAVGAVSTTLVQFLQGPLAPCLHRCVFVVTKLAQVREGERDELIEHVRRRLRRDCGIADPIVLAASVGVVLDHLAGDNPPDGAYWLGQFEALESRLRDLVRLERCRSVAESLLRLLGELFETIEPQLEMDQERLAGDAEELRRTSRRDVDSVAAEEQRHGNERPRRPKGRTRVARILDPTSPAKRRRVARRGFGRQSCVDTGLGAVGAVRPSPPFLQYGHHG